jgi:2-desacetyl-2-hydroxyethyl bacteriochlorophyllide A dehydrogenase
MRAAVLRGGRMVCREDVAEPVPTSGQVLVGVRACGICGSDLHFAKHGAEMLCVIDQMRGAPIGGGLDLAQDVFMGHEFAAEVLDAGPDTQAPPAGTIVTSVPVLLSQRGIESLVYTNSAVGGYAERMLLSAPLLLTVPNGLDPRQAALTEPLAVGLHAVNKAGVRQGDSTLVVGCGPVGVAVIAALKSQGVERIVAADFSPKRRQLAETMGAHQTVDPAQESPYDVVRPAVIFESVGLPGILDEVMRMAPANSHVVSVGACMEPDPLRPVVAAMKELSLQFVFGYSPEEFAATLRAIAEGEIDVAPLITGQVGLAEVGSAFDELASPAEHCKILVTP